jgi:hypothetical protein
MVTPVSNATRSSYIEIPVVLTTHQQERIRAMQKCLSAETGEERESVLEAIRDFLGEFKVGIKNQMIAKYFEMIRSEIYS